MLIMALKQNKRLPFLISNNRADWDLTLTETLIILNITKTESNNCFIINCFEESNDKHTVARNVNCYCHWKSRIPRTAYRLVT